MPYRPSSWLGGSTYRLAFNLADGECQCQNIFAGGLSKLFCWVFVKKFLPEVCQNLCLTGSMVR